MSNAVVRVLREALEVVKRQDGAAGDLDIATLEKLYRDAEGDWSQRFEAVLQKAFPDRADALAKQFGRAFGVSFQEAHTPQSALADVVAIERLLGQKAPVVIEFATQEQQGDTSYHLNVYHEGDLIAPSRLLRIVEKLGFTPINDYHFDCEVRAEGGARQIHIHDFPIIMTAEAWPNVIARHATFEEAVQAIWQGHAGTDRLNELLLLANLGLREVVLLRAVGRYLMQARLPYSQDYFAEILVRHAEVSRLLVDYFHARFDPQAHDADKAAEKLTDIEAYIAKVKSLDEDRILRRALNVLQAVVRTNFYQGKDYISLKIRSADVHELPRPLPLFETFVYAHRVEGVHLRSARISRGGIRWSERREDFRDEVLDLMKSQTVKNSVIVPAGAKGGFYVKYPPMGGDRKAMQAEGIACYQIFVRGLLDVADNWVDGHIVKPQNVVCHDEDDPYLVVAADKGTATFSDIANALSAEYNFWLGDAFASGGSAGYDHKKMAITARGAWESVRHHGYCLGMDVEKDPVTIVGVGDMGGDVFGNGLLRSRSARLLGAFSHSHIFCDPDPDAAISFAERERLFVAMGNWDQYDTSKLSKGGRIFSRTEKELALTPEIKACFGLTVDRISPQDLMRAMLRAPVDILWFGGIGTYIKSSHERDSDVRDKANDNNRIIATELRCKILGEGANLAISQGARIEASQAGVSLNTDFIDNSAGVNSSDYEVNIKILLNQLMVRGDLSLADRNTLLASMTDEVAELVLENNRQQNFAITVAQHMSVSRVPHFGRIVEELEVVQQLDRRLEGLPSVQELQALAAAGKGLTRPEICVVLSHTKLLITEALMQDSLVDDPLLQNLLQSYFPHPIIQRFPKAIQEHPLRANIIAMMIANKLVNQTSPFMAKWLSDRTGLDYVAIGRAFCINSKLFGFQILWHNAFYAPDIAAAAKRDLLIELLQHMDRTLPWFLNQNDLLRDLQGAVDRYSGPLEEIKSAMPDLLPPLRRHSRDQHEQYLLSVGISAELAKTHADLRSLAAAPGIIALAIALDKPALDVARVYFQAGERFGFDALREQARQSMGSDYWERQAISSLIEDFSAHQLRLTRAAMAYRADLHLWMNSDPVLVQRLDAVMAELRKMPKATVTQLTVANRQLRGLVPSRA